MNLIIDLAAVGDRHRARRSCWSCAAGRCSQNSLRFAARDFLALLPRIAIGMIGSGFIAEMLPQHLIPSWLGADTGPRGLIDRERSRAH